MSKTDVIEKRVFGEIPTYDKESDYKPEPMYPEVLELVSGGIKATALVTALTAKRHEAQTVRFNYHGVEKGVAYFVKPMPVYENIGDVVCYINRLVNEGKLIELEYELPHMSYRTKSMYFLAGTKMRLIEKVHTEL